MKVYEFTSEQLDELVHEEMSDRASAINNISANAQLEFLLDSGWTEEQIA